MWAAGGGRGQPTQHKSPTEQSLGLPSVIPSHPKKEDWLELVMWLINGRGALTGKHKSQTHTVSSRDTNTLINVQCSGLLTRLWPLRPHLPTQSSMETTVIGSLPAKDGSATLYLNPSIFLSCYLKQNSVSTPGIQTVPLLLLSGGRIVTPNAQVHTLSPHEDSRLEQGPAQGSPG